METMSKVGHVPQVMRPLHRKLDAGKATENNLQGSRVARKVGYTRWDDQPGSNPFDLRIVVALGDAILESRRFAQMQAVPRDVPPNPAFAGGSESAIIIIEKTRLFGKRILAVRCAVRIPLFGRRTRERATDFRDR
jgi:hypothetical protein